MASERGRDSVPRNELPVRLSNTKWIYIYIQQSMETTGLIYMFVYIIIIKKRNRNIYI